MHMIVRSARQPGPDRRRFMGGVVVHDDVDVEAIGNVSVDSLEEVQKFGRAVPLVAFADDEAGGDVECGKQRGRTMTDIGVGSALRHTGHHRQNRLFAVERLDLAFLIDTKDQRPVGRRQIEADNIADLVDEKRIVRKLEGLRAMRVSVTLCKKVSVSLPLIGDSHGIGFFT